MDQPLKRPSNSSAQVKALKVKAQEISEPSRPRLESETKEFETKDSNSRPIGLETPGFKTYEFKALISEIPEFRDQGFKLNYHLKWYLI
jgi:hypothetical protein